MSGYVMLLGKAKVMFHEGFFRKISCCACLLHRERVYSLGSKVSSQMAEAMNKSELVK